MREREHPATKRETNLPPVWAVRSLAWNRMLLPVIQARLERAESVIRAHLLLNGNGGLRVGPYHISLNGEEEVVMTRLETSDWCQLPLPESKKPLADSLEDAVEVYHSERDTIIYAEEDERD